MILWKAMLIREARDRGPLVPQVWHLVRELIWGLFGKPPDCAAEVVL